MKPWVVRALLAAFVGSVAGGFINWLLSPSVPSEPAARLIQSLETDADWERIGTLGGPDCVVSSKTRSLKVVRGWWLATVHLTSNRFDDAPTELLSWSDRYHINRAMIRRTARIEGAALSASPQTTSPRGEQP